MIYEYIRWLAIFVALPTLLLWIFRYQQLCRYIRTIAFCIFWALVFSIPWDIWAVRNSVWSFPSETNLGVWLGGLPLEEYLFIVLVTLFISSITIVLVTRLSRRPQ